MSNENLWPWEEDECQTLRNTLRKHNASASRADRITQKKLAAAMGFSPATVSAYLNGERALSLKFALKFQAATGVPIRSFSPRLADEAADAHK